MNRIDMTRGRANRALAGGFLLRSIALLGVLGGLVGGKAAPAESLFGITNKDAGGSAGLVRIDPDTGQAQHLRSIAIPQGFVPESMTFHDGIGEFVIVLSASDYHAPFALLRYEPRSDTAIVAPVSGFPPTQQKLHGIEYHADLETLMVVFGASDAHLENRVASVSTDGVALQLSPNIGVGDIDYLAWPDATGEMILSDPNAHNGFARLLSLHDPFGTPEVELYADTPYYAALGDPAVRRSDLAFFTIQYGDSGGSLLQLVGESYEELGVFGTDEQVVGIAFATISCPGDLTGDGLVDGADLAVLMSAWGSAEGDLDENGVTDPADLAMLLGYWGPCFDPGQPAG